MGICGLYLYELGSSVELCKILISDRSLSTKQKQVIKPIKSSQITPASTSNFSYLGKPIGQQPSSENDITVY